VAIDGVARRLVEGAGAGLFAEPEDPDSFIQALDTLRSQPRRMEAMGEAGYRHAAAHYDRQALAEKYLALLERLAGGSERRVVAEDRPSLARRA